MIYRQAPGPSQEISPFDGGGVPVYFSYTTWLDGDKRGREGRSNWEGGGVDDFDAASWYFVGLLLRKVVAVRVIYRRT